jgi:hypothetical protein
MPPGYIERKIEAIKLRNELAKKTFPGRWKSATSAGKNGGLAEKYFFYLSISQ